MTNLKPIFPSGLIISQHISTMEDVEKYAPKWNLDFMSLSEREFSVDFNLFHTNNIQLALSDYGLELAVHGDPPPHCITFVLTLHGTLLSKKDTITKQHMVIMEASDEMDAFIFGPVQTLNISINRNLFIQRYEKRFNEEYPIKESYSLSLCKEEVLDIVKKTLLNILAGSKESMSTFHFAENIQSIENTIINNMLLLLKTSDEYCCKSKPVDIAYTLYEAIQANFSSDIDINTLCSELKISRSNAYLTFKNHYRMTPKHYLDIIRLNHVRKILLLGNPHSIQINQVAMMNGFYHMGNFAKMYKKLFHELPSATLNKNKG